MTVGPNADPYGEFIAIQYTSVVYQRDPQTQRPIVQRQEKWTTPEDYVRWLPIPVEESEHLSPEQVSLMVKQGSLKEGKAGELLSPQGTLTDEEVLAKLDRPITDTELQDLQEKIDRDWQAKKSGSGMRPCCPWCYSFYLSYKEGKCYCRCGWNSGEEPHQLHRRSPV